MRYLNRDSCASEIVFDQEKADNITLQTRLDSITREHGGISMVFNLTLTLSRPTISILLGIGFIKMLFLCGSTLFLVV